MRKFYIENEKGVRIDLNGGNGIYLVNPTGLGQSNNDGFASIKNGFFTRTKNDVKQSSIVADVVFTKEPYKTYETFSDFINTAESLTFIYKPLSTEYRCNVVLSYMTKTELSEGKWLEIPISFACLGQWYKATPVSINFSDPTKNNYFRWGTGRWGKDVLASNTSGEFSAEVNAAGHIPAAIKLVFSGKIEYPTITLKGESTDKVYGRCKLSGIYEGKLELDTSYGLSSIKCNGEDLINDVDLSYEPFFRIPLDEPCMVIIESAEFKGTCEAKIYEYFRSV